MSTQAAHFLTHARSRTPRVTFTHTHTRELQAQSEGPHKLPGTRVVICFFFYGFVILCCVMFFAPNQKEEFKTKDFIFLVGGLRDWRGQQIMGSELTGQPHRQRDAL